jgi:hypothetical protein
VIPACIAGFLYCLIGAAEILDLLLIVLLYQVQPTQLDKVSKFIVAASSLV